MGSSSPSARKSSPLIASTGRPVGQLAQVRSPHQVRSRARPISQSGWGFLSTWKEHPVAAALLVIAFWTAVSAAFLSSWLICSRSACDCGSQGTGQVSSADIEAGDVARRLSGVRKSAAVFEASSGGSRRPHMAGDAARVHEVGSAAEGWWVQRLKESGQWKVETTAERGLEIPPETSVQYSSWVHRVLQGIADGSVVSHRDSFACMLVLRDVCHVWHPDRHVSGYWYAKGGADLAALVSREDVCGHKGRHIPLPFSVKEIQTLQDVQEKMGIFLSPSQLAGLHAIRQLHFHEQTTKSAEEIPLQANGTPGAPTPGANTGAGAGPPPFAEGASGRVLRSSHRARAILSPHDSFLGHFVERGGGLAEISAALAASLGGDLSTPSQTVPTSLVHTPSQKVAAYVRRALSLSVRTPPGDGSALSTPAQASLGGTTPAPAAAGPLLEDAEAQLRGGRLSCYLELTAELSHECFQEALFPLNAIHSRRGVRTFKRKVREWLRGSSSSFQPETPRASIQPTDPPPATQVTWLWRHNRRTIANKGEVLKTLLASCGLPVHVVEFSEASSFRDVVATMQRSWLVVGMHGSALSNMIFMQDNTAVLELVPFLYRYQLFMKLAKAYGVQGWQWTNTERRNAAFDSGCFIDRLWRNATTNECWVNKSCLRCVRDHAITTVDVHALGNLLSAIQRTWGPT